MVRHTKSAADVDTEDEEIPNDLKHLRVPKLLLCKDCDLPKGK